MAAHFPGTRSRRRVARALATLVTIAACLGGTTLGQAVVSPPVAADDARGATVPGAPAAPSITAASAVLMDVSSGRVLYSKASHVKRPPASLTKIMTALLALETSDPAEAVEVSAAAASVEGSSIWLAEGEVQTMEDLLYGLLLRSGNDAAVAIAEHIAGSVDDFALLMNRRAEAAGALDTHFRNPHGLPSPGHLTTAADMALIAREALLRPDFRELVSTRRHVIPWPGQPTDRAVYNENRLLWLYPGADGVKTGWTEEAGRCLVASATRDGWQLVVVVLDAPEMWTDATELLDWGFSSFRSVVVFAEGATVSEARVAGVAERWVPLTASREVRVALLPGEEDELRAVPEPAPFVKAPASRGMAQGSLSLEVGGVPLAGVPLLLGEDVPVGGVVGRFLEDLWLLLRGALERLIGFGRT